MHDDPLPLKWLWRVQKNICDIWNIEDQTYSITELVKLAPTKENIAWHKTHKRTIRTSGGLVLLRHAMTFEHKKL